MKNNKIMLLIFLLIGLILGGLIGDILGDYIPLLNYSKSIGINSFNLDLSLLKMNFSFQMRLNLAGLIGIVLAIILYRKL